jgi:hypothetical protein
VFNLLEVPLEVGACVCLYLSKVAIEGNYFMIWDVSKLNLNLLEVRLEVKSICTCVYIFGKYL